MKKHTNDSIDNLYILKGIKTKRIEDYKGLGTKILHICPKCNEEWNVSPRGVLRNSGCKACYSKEKVGSSIYTKDDYNQILSEKNIKTKPKDDYINKNTKINHLCGNCGEEWLVTPKRLLNSAFGVCPSCSKSIQSQNSVKTNEQYVKELEKLNNGVIALEEYTNKRKFLHKCVCGNEWMGLPGNILRGHLCTLCKFKGNFWDESFYRNKKTILYYVKINDYYKIGVTLYKKNIKNSVIGIRFAPDIKNNIDISIIKTKVFDNGAEAFVLEQRILELFTEYRNPTDNKIIYSGNTEILTKDIIKDLNEMY